MHYKYLSTQINTIIHHSAFGSAIADMQYVNDTNKNYRYGFNNQEKDNEIVGKGDYYSFENRILDVRMGRFLSMDPLYMKFPSCSPYSFANNCPILFIDYMGNEPSQANIRRPTPRHAQTNIRRGLAYENNRPIITTYNKMRVTLTVQNNNSNNRNRNKISPPQSNTSSVPPVYAQFRLGHEGGMSTPGTVDFYSGFIDVKNIVFQIKDLFFIETIKTNSQGVTTTYITAEFDHLSESGKLLMAEEKKWQDGLNARQQAIYDQKPEWNETEYNALQTEQEKKDYKASFDKKAESYVANLNTNLTLAKAMYINENGKSPMDIFDEKAREYLDKNADHFQITETETIIQPVIYSTR